MTLYSAMLAIVIKGQTRNWLAKTIVEELMGVEVTIKDQFNGIRWQYGTEPFPKFKDITKTLRELEGEK
jgi:hypothetical protein